MRCNGPISVRNVATSFVGVTNSQDVGIQTQTETSFSNQIFEKFKMNTVLEIKDVLVQSEKNS